MKLIPLGGRSNEYLFKPDGSEIIWVSRSKAGFGRKQNSLHTKSSLEARDKRDAFFKEWLGQKPLLSKKVKRFAGSLWDDWIETKSKKSFKTKESINTSGQHLKPYLDEMFPSELTDAWWLNVYIPEKIKKGPRKFFNDRKWLSSFLLSLHRDGLLSRLPRLECPDAPAAKGIYLTDSEINSLYAFSNEDLGLQIDLGFKHFMRRSEVLLLPYSEIDWNLGLIDLPMERTKIRKGRKVPLSDSVLSRLEARRRVSESPFVFPSPKNLNRSVGRLGNATAWRATLARAFKSTTPINSEATFHDLRHSGLTRAFAATGRYLEVCAVAGLSLEVAQKTYLHLQPEHLKFVAGLVTSGSK